MAITNGSGTINLRYAASAKLRAAYLAFEALNLTSNPDEVADAEAACADAMAAVIAAGATGVLTGSTVKVISSGVEFASPEATGVYVNGYTPTIVNGVVTALVAG